MEIDLQPTLKDDLTLLRPLLASDFEDLYQVAKDPKIWEQHQSKDRFKLPVFKIFFEESINSGGALAIEHQQTRAIIGSSRFKLLHTDPVALEIGWSFLARKFWGGTFNRSFKNQMINHAFGFASCVVFYVDQHNLRSQKAVEKLGATLLPSTQNHHLLTPIKTNLTYLIQKEEWNLKLKV